jgi:hypothetical protein
MKRASKIKHSGGNKKKKKASDREVPCGGLQRLEWCPDGDELLQL